MLGAALRTEPSAGVPGQFGTLQGRSITTAVGYFTVARKSL